MAESPKAQPARQARLPRFVSVWLALGVSAVLACGPDFPNMLLSQGDRAVLVAPVANFQREIDRMQLAKSRYKYKAPAEGADESMLAEVADLREALRHAGKSKQELDEIVARHTEQRMELRNASKQIEITNGLPPEFADYFRGAIAWRRADLEPVDTEQANLFQNAFTTWRQILERPESERKFKSTWAAYMLGVIELLPGRSTEKALAHFQTVRSLVDAGFADSLGLAAASLGLEAQTYLRDGKLARSIELYLEQHATGDPTAIQSLRMVSAQALRPGHREHLKDLALHPTTRRVLTAYLVSRRKSWDDAENQKVENTLLAWLELLESENIRELDLAEQLALAAYQSGQMEMARRWLRRSSPESFAAQWLDAKLLLYDGKLDEAAAVLARLSPRFPQNQSTNSPGVNGFVGSLVVPSSGSVSDVPSCDQVFGELGVVHLARREFTEALDTLLRSGFWVDAAYVAEKVLTLPELSAYVDANWPANPDNPNQPAIQPPAFNRTTDPEALRIEIRYLLGRRLVRSQQEEKARAYFPQHSQERLNEFLSARQAARNEKRPFRERARDLFRSATIMRQNGLELCGTEVEPDWHAYGGSFDVGVTADDREKITAPTTFCRAGRNSSALTNIGPSLTTVFITATSPHTLASKHRDSCLIMMTKPPAFCTPLVPGLRTATPKPLTFSTRRW